MDNLNKSQDNNKYHQYTDYIFKATLKKYANGVLKFLNSPYKIQNIIISEITDFGPKIHRLDFAGIVKKKDEEICLMLECQSKLPTEDDIARFFQYISSLRVLKNRKVELYILCIRDVPYDKKEYVINDDCTYTMHLISLKRFKATQIIKNIEKKIENKEKISEEDIASLQLIAYTTYSQTTYEILEKAYDVVEKLDIETNEKIAIFYILNVLSTNMLNEDDRNRLIGGNKMLLNPREEYFKNQGIEEGRKEGKKEGKIEIAIKLLNKGMPLKEIIELTGLTEKQIQNAK